MVVGSIGGGQLAAERSAGRGRPGRLSLQVDMVEEDGETGQAQDVVCVDVRDKHLPDLRTRHAAGVLQLPGCGLAAVKQPNVLQLGGGTRRRRRSTKEQVNDSHR